MGNQQLSIHINSLLDYLKSSENYCPRKLFSGSNSSPEKSLQKNRSIFCSKIGPATGVRSSWNKWDNDKGSVHLNVHPKTLIKIAMVLSTNSGSFPSNSHVSATFSILLRFGEFWKGRILRNLCGKKTVRNCDLFYRSVTVFRCSGTLHRCMYPLLN